MGWLPRGFEHPVRVAVPGGYHLRPINADDVDLDYPAVMGSRTRLWAMFGAAWGWPTATMTYEQDRDDLARHAAEITAHQSFNYALLDEPETALLGCVYIDLASVTADVAATRELLALLAPVLSFRAPHLVGKARRELTVVLHSIARTRVNGRWTAVEALALGQRERVDAAVGAALETLARVPDQLQVRGGS